MKVKPVENIGNYKIEYTDFGIGFIPCELQSLEMTAKEMFEKLGYEYSYNDGFIEYLRGEPIPNRINANYIKFKKITFNKMDMEMSVYSYRKDVLCQENIKDDSITVFNYFDANELKAINQQCKELWWDNEL